mmetsp:Transcript_42730/g.127705  ORF Transcript_42730/g.127705 Transcript_42730/m.127705 type:complete len:214 (+) Transcript_42730:336-977(+)
MSSTSDNGGGDGGSRSLSSHNLSSLRDVNHPSQQNRNRLLPTLFRDNADLRLKLLVYLEILGAEDLTFDCECPPARHSRMHLLVRQQRGVQLRKEALFVQVHADDDHGAAAVAPHWVPQARLFQHLPLLVLAVARAARREGRRERVVDLQLYVPAGHVELNRTRVGVRHPQLPLGPHDTREGACARAALPQAGQHRFEPARMEGPLGAAEDHA